MRFFSFGKKTFLLDKRASQFSSADK